MIQRCFRSLFTRRFVHSSPSTQPGFLTFSFVEELKAQQRHHRLHEQPDSAASSDSRLLQGLGTISAPLKTEPPSIPGTLSQMLRPLFTPHSYQPRLSGLMSVSELKQAITFYPNQNELSTLELLRLRPTENILAEEPAWTNPEEDTNAPDSTALTFSHDKSTADAVECANVLKKRRRRMRGHKHKKRLKERRHKANK